MEQINIHQVYNSREEISVIRDIRINLLPSSTPQIGATHTVEQKSGSISFKIAKILAVVGAVMLVIYFTPQVISLFSNFKLSNPEITQLSEAKEASETRILPSFNPALPKANKLIIPSIGVNTDIGEATYDNYETALQKGVWRVSNFGEPDFTGAPMILAAHRFGYLAWTNSFRHSSSFYNLPKVKVGDTVTIYWNQREYVYGVYKTENGTEISDYSGDLILYTCESLSGKERIFVYAKLVTQ